MPITHRWQKEPGARLQASRDLDSAKLQAPGIVRVPSGGYRLFYTAVGPGKPFPACQGYILSAFSEDGLSFHTEPGIRIAPDPKIPHMSLRILAPTVTRTTDGRWRMYFEARGPASVPTVIMSAISVDMLHWELEEGIRLQGAGSVRAPRYLLLPDGRGRIYYILTENDPHTGRQTSQSVVSAVTSDGLNFQLEPGYRLRDRQGIYDAVGITAGEVIPPETASDPWSMIFSAWQDVPPGTVVPLHPSHDVDAENNGVSEDFAAASIRADLCGYRSRIFIADSIDGVTWGPSTCIIEGDGFGGKEMDAIHAEDMAVIRLGPGKYRMYYASCDTAGNWRVLSAITEDN